MKKLSKIVCLICCLCLVFSSNVFAMEGTVFDSQNTADPETVSENTEDITQTEESQTKEDAGEITETLQETQVETVMSENTIAETVEETKKQESVESKESEIVETAAESESTAKAEQTKESLETEETVEEIEETVINAEFGDEEDLLYEAGASTSITVSGTFNYTEAYSMFNLMNSQRSANGKGALVLDKELMDVAHQRAAELYLLFSHQRPDGRNWDEGFTDNDCGENIARGQANASAAMTAFMNSAGHRENILFTGFKSVGVACFEVDGYKYWIQVFGYDTAKTESKRSNATQNVSVSVSAGNLNVDLTVANTQLNIGGQTTGTVSATYSNKNIKASGVSWKSSNTNIIQVSSGTIKGYAAGTASVTASMGSVSDSCSIVVTASAANLQNIKNFVSRFYEKILNRSADTGGLNNWVSGLSSGKYQGAELGYGFIQSQEFLSRNLSDSQFVDVLYAAFFDRAADAGGKAQWLAKLSGGMSRNFVYTGFVGSQEFINLCKKYGITPGSITLTDPMDQNEGITMFVCRCYDKALGRKGDTAGINNWCKILLTKQMTPEEVAKGFIFSSEMNNKKLSNAEFVKVCYRVFLGREYDQGGLNSWVSQLNSGKTRESVFYGFSGSGEFKAIVASYGL